MEIDEISWIFLGVHRICVVVVAEQAARAARGHAWAGRGIPSGRMRVLGTPQTPLRSAGRTKRCQREPGAQLKNGYKI